MKQQCFRCEQSKLGMHSIVLLLLSTIRRFLVSMFAEWTFVYCTLGPGCTYFLSRRGPLESTPCKVFRAPHGMQLSSVPLRVWRTNLIDTELMPTTLSAL